MALSENFMGKVARVRAELEKSALPLEATEQLFDILGSATLSANGALDKIQSISETLLLSVLLNIEDRVQAEQTLSRALEAAARAHDEGCLFKNSRYGRTIGLAVTVKWPVAVVLCVAMVTNNVDKIMDAFARFL